MAIRPPRGVSIPQDKKPVHTEPDVDVSKFIPKNTQLQEIKEQDAFNENGVDVVLRAKYKTTLTESSAHIQTLAERMETYLENMGPRATIYSGVDGARNQQYLVNTILKALSSKDMNELLMGIDVVLWYIHTNRDGAFRNEAVYRYLTLIDRRPEVVDDYTKFIEIFLRIADPASRVAQARSGEIRKAITTIQQQHTEAAANIVIYLTSY